MAKAREFLKRRQSVASTRKITRTMEMISTAKFKQSFDRAVGTRPYAEKLTEMLEALSSARSEVHHPLMEERDPPRKASVLVLTANRGLCGGYNANVLRTAQACLTDLERAGVEVDLHVSGKRGISFFHYLGRPMASAFTDLAHRPDYEPVAELANRFIEAYSEARTDRVVVVYMRFLSSARQKPNVQVVLPVQPPEGAETRKGSGDVIFDPDADSIFRDLLPLYVRTNFFGAYLDAVTSEQVARMVAMKAATDAADEMIKILTRKYNRARQAQITSEIAEIVGGAEALK